MDKQTQDLYKYDVQAMISSLKSKLANAEAQSSEFEALFNARVKDIAERDKTIKTLEAKLQNLQKVNASKPVDTGKDDK